MQILYYISIAIFIYGNYKIVLSDFREKKIPNKYIVFLLCLLPIYYWILQIMGESISIQEILLQTLISILISFFLYYYWIWSAGDAKYVLVLSLFLPNNGIIPFIGNIWLITLFYLFGYFLYFYFYRCLFDWKYTKELSNKVLYGIKESIYSYIYISDNKKSLLIRIIKYILIFIILFVSIRLVRMYLYEYFFVARDNYGYIFEFIKNNPTLIIITILVTIFLMNILIRKMVTILKEYIHSKFSKNSSHSYLKDIIFLFILYIPFCSFIWYEYTLNPNELTSHIYTIFTFSLAFFFFAKVSYYIYTLTFQLSETEIIPIKKLSIGDIVDKNYLTKLFWDQKALWYCHNIKKVDENNEQKWLLLYPRPKEYFSNIHNPIDEEEWAKLQEIYKIVNDYHRYIPWYASVENIKILRTFAFWFYIFLGFLITYFQWDIIARKIITTLIQLFHNNL